LLVFLEGVIVNITPPWIRAPLGKRPYISDVQYISDIELFEHNFYIVHKKNQKENA
jgi:hypothetical protein